MMWEIILGPINYYFLMHGDFEKRETLRCGGGDPLEVFFTWEIIVYAVSGSVYEGGALARLGTTTGPEVRKASSK